MAHPFSEEEHKKGIAALKNNKAACRDVLVEQLKQLGQKTNTWLHTILNVCFHRKQDPLDMETIQDYRHTQARERLRDSEELQTNLPLLPYVQTLRTNDVKQRILKEQAGFRTGKSCTSQLLNLTQHIERHDHRCSFRRPICCLRHSEL